MRNPTCFSSSRTGLEGILVRLPVAKESIGLDPVDDPPADGDGLLQLDVLLYP